MVKLFSDRERRTSAELRPFIFHQTPYGLGLLVTLGLYVLVFGWLLISTDFLPYVTDNNESFSVLWHSYSLYTFDFFKSFGLTDEAYSPSAAAHPFAHTHQGNWPRVFGFLIYALGARTVESQILVTTSTIGVVAFFFCYHFFAKTTTPLFAVLFCAFLMTDYILYTQWHVVTYRVWQLFFLFSSLLCAARIGGDRKLLWGAITILNYACLFYYELVFATFVTGMAGLYVISLHWRNPRVIIPAVGCQIVGALFGLSVLAVQLIGYYGLENLKTDLLFTVLSRNYEGLRPGLMDEMKEFYGSNNIAFWYNLDDNRKYLSVSSFVRSFFHYDFQIHTPIFTMLTISMVFPIVGIFLSSMRRMSPNGESRSLLVFLPMALVGSVAFLVLAWGRIAIGLSVLGVLLVVGCLLLMAYRLSDYTFIESLPAWMRRGGDAVLDLGLIFSFTLLAMMLTLPDALEGLRVQGSWLGISDTFFAISDRQNATLGILGGLSFGFATLVIIKLFMGHGLARIPSHARGGQGAAVVLVYCLAAVIGHQGLLYNQGYKWLLIGLQENTLPTTIVAIAVYASAILGAMLIIGGQNTSEDAFWKPISRLRRFFICGFLAYVFVYALSAGYVHTGYLQRSTPFTVFLTNAILAVGLYVQIRFACLAIKAPEAIGLKYPRVALGLPICVAAVTVIYWFALQLSYIHFLPPDHYSFLKDLAKSPYKGRSFAVGNYSAPTAAFTGQWAFMDFGDGSRVYEETGNGIEVERDLSYLWMADRGSNPEYLKPDYYLCMTGQTIGTVTAILANRKDRATNSVGCGSMVKTFQESAEYSHPLPKHRLFAKDEEGVARRGWVAWAILKMDWDFPPIVQPMEDTSFMRPTRLRVDLEKNGYRLDYDYRYYQQDGEPEGETVVQLVKLGADAQCRDDPSKVMVLEHQAGTGKGTFRLAKRFIGKVAVRVMPRSKNKSADWWYYSSTISFSFPGSSGVMPITCPVNIAYETNLEVTAKRPAGDEIKLQWTRVIDAASYEVQMATDGQPWRKSSGVDRRLVLYTIRDISPDSGYSFRVRACDLENKCSPYSRKISLGPPTSSP